MILPRSCWERRVLKTLNTGDTGFHRGKAKWRRVTFVIGCGAYGLLGRRVDPKIEARALCPEPTHARDHKACRTIGDRPADRARGKAFAEGKGCRGARRGSASAARRSRKRYRAATGGRFVFIAEPGPRCGAFAG